MKLVALCWVALFWEALLLLLLLEGGVEGECEESGLINGCSIPSNLPFPFRETFRQACNRHDVCYGCGSTRGLDRQACDDAFYSDMVDICREVQWRVVHCLKYAMIYFGAVRLWGEDRFQGISSFCSEHWVDACLP